MSGVCLKPINSLKSEAFSSIFSTYCTEAKSCIFVKHLTTTCVSSILYLRKIFPEDYFESKDFEGLSLKVLKSGKKYKHTRKISEWLDGAFEALDKKYLKNLMLDIKDANSEMTLEVYTMTFIHHKENEALNILLSNGATDNNKGSMGCFEMSDTHQKTVKLLQMCDAVTKSCSNLPSQVALAMRLSYYKNTPQDYQPSGYKALNSTVLKFPKLPRSIEIGVTETAYHLFKLVNKSCYNNKFFKRINNFKKEKNRAKKELCFDSIHQNFLSSQQTNKCVSIPGDRQKDFTITHKIQNTNTEESPTELIPNILVPSRNFNKVRCPCQSDEQTNLMFHCSNCYHLVHAECFGTLQLKYSKKIRFYCNICHNAENNIKCYDKVMTNLNNPNDQQKLALLRRVLKFCEKPSIKKISLKKIEKIASLKCPKIISEIVFKKTIEIGVAMPDGKKKNYIINKEELNKQLNHYFYKFQTPTRIQSKMLIETKTSQSIKRKNFDLINTLKKKKMKPENFIQETNQAQLNLEQISQQSNDIFH